MIQDMKNGGTIILLNGDDDLLRDIRSDQRCRACILRNLVTTSDFRATDIRTART